MCKHIDFNIEATRWLIAHWKECEIMCGVKPADSTCCWQIADTLKATGFQELSQLMVVRALLLEELEKTEPDRIVGASDACKESVKNGAIPL
ncbi:hypothetical protein [uncultured Dysosmobacter sp.]|uniref:hypothetical protein n=1 Tax=uncultured Dysosmobacter sp. TaxID=2591384 RepID=UPI002622D9BE|nr:hypothetical protein [uncultured Dysosmobacter sp.]